MTHQVRGINFLASFKVPNLLYRPSEKGIFFFLSCCAFFFYFESIKNDKKKKYGGKFVGRILTSSLILN